LFQETYRFQALRLEKTQQDELSENTTNGITAELSITQQTNCVVAIIAVMGIETSAKRVAYVSNDDEEPLIKAFKLLMFNYLHFDSWI